MRITNLFLIATVLVVAASARGQGVESITQNTKTGAVLNAKPSNFSPGQLQVGGNNVTVPPTVQGYQSTTVSAAGNNNSTIATPTHTVYVTANAGSGAYTSTFSVPTSGRTAGDTESAHLHFAASTNPTVEIHNNTSGGTLLFTWTGDGTVTDIFAELRFDGANWFLMDAHFVQ